jgi:MFS family permease
MTNAETAATPLLKNANFLRFWLGQGISVLGSQISGLAFPVLAVTILGASEWQMGVLNAANSAAFLVVGLPAGALIDRMIKRRVMLAADLVRLLCLGAIPALYFTGLLQMWHLIVLGTIAGIATVFFDVSYQSFIPLLLKGDQIGEGNSRLESTSQISGLLGPAVVGWLLSIVKAPLMMVFDAISYAVSAISLATVKSHEVRKPVEDRQPLHVEIREGIAFVLKERLIFRIACTTATTNFFTTAIFTLLPLYLLRDLHLPVTFYGLMGTAAGVGGLLGSVATPKLIARIGEGTLITASAVFSGICPIGFVVVGSIPGAWQGPWLMLVEAIQAFFILTYNITQVSARQRLCPPELLGRMNASIRFFIWGVMPISALISGGVASAVGILPTLWVGAVGASLACLFVVFSPLTKMRKLPDGPSAA